MSQDSLADLIPPPDFSEPATPHPPHATLPEAQAAAVQRMQSSRIDSVTNNTLPPYTQDQTADRARTRTPTRTMSHISTPPPTIEFNSRAQHGCATGASTGTMGADEAATASVEELRGQVASLQHALKEAKMSSAHHQLQYSMLLQESASQRERMAVEARMAQYENDIINSSEQTRTMTTPVHPPPMPDGMIPVQKELHQRMLRDIQQLTSSTGYLEGECKAQEKLIGRQEIEIASLTDKVTLMRERIRGNREHLDRLRGRSTRTTRIESTPRSVYSKDQNQAPFAALLQASEMARQQGSKKGHSRNTHSLSSLPTTPARMQKSQPMYQTPAGRQPPMKVPSTAPMPRTNAIRTPGQHHTNSYAQPLLPVPHTRGPASEGTVSASDRDEQDSEAETDILDPEGDEVVETQAINESQASRAASQMLFSTPSQQAQKRKSFEGSGMLSGLSGNGSQGEQQRMTQTKLFGAVRKANAGTFAGADEQPPAKRARLVEPIPAPQQQRQVVGLGIDVLRD